MSESGLAKNPNEQTEPVITQPDVVEPAVSEIDIQRESLDEETAEESEIETIKNLKKEAEKVIDKNISASIEPKNKEVSAQKKIYNYDWEKEKRQADAINEFGDKAIKKGLFYGAAGSAAAVGGTIYGAYKASEFAVKKTWGVAKLITSALYREFKGESSDFWKEFEDAKKELISEDKKDKK